MQRATLGSLPPLPSVPFLPIADIVSSLFFFDLTLASLLPASTEIFRNMTCQDRLIALLFEVIVVYDKATLIRVNLAHTHRPQSALRASETPSIEKSPLSIAHKKKRTCIKIG